MAKNNRTIARPYAKAVFEKALEQKAVASFWKGLHLLAQIALHPDAQTCLESPNFTQAQRYDLFVHVAGDHINEPLNNFLKLLCEKNRLAILPDVFSVFEQLRDEHEQRSKVYVLSSMPLEEEMKEKISNAFATRLQREIELECSVDENLIGGAVITYGDKVLDGSVIGQIKQMKYEISA